MSERERAWRVREREWGRCEGERVGKVLEWGGCERLNKTDLSQKGLLLIETFHFLERILSAAICNSLYSRVDKVLAL